MENKNMVEGSILYLDPKPCESTNMGPTEEKRNARPIKMRPLQRIGRDHGAFNQRLQN